MSPVYDKMLPLADLNCMDFEKFTDHLNNVIEHCPVLAAALWTQRPFNSVNHMVSEMAKIVSALPLSGTYNNKTEYFSVQRCPE